MKSIGLGFWQIAVILVTMVSIGLVANWENSTKKKTEMDISAMC